MAVIYSYPFKQTPKGGDSMIISDLEDRKFTKQITLFQLQNLVDTTYQLSTKTNIANPANIDIDLTDKNGVVSAIEVAAGNNVTLTNNSSRKYTIDAAGDKNFVFTNTNTSILTWYITHNLNKFPSVSVFDSSIPREELYGRVEYVDLNNVTITFSSGFSGTATLN